MKLAQDKKLHLLGGMAISVVGALVYLLQLKFSPEGSAIAGVVIAAVIGAAKEWIYDAGHEETHTVDVWDFVATAAGGVIGAVCFYAAHYMMR